MMDNKKSLEDKLNFINNAKQTNIAKINIESIERGRVKTNPIIIKKYYKFSVH